MTAVFRSMFFTVIGMRVLLMKTLLQPSPRIGRRAAAFGPRFKDVARLVRKCSRSRFGVIRTTPKRVKRLLASSARLLAQVDQLAGQEKILKSRSEERRVGKEI